MSERLDSEISVRGLVLFVVGLAGLMIVAGALMWLLSVRLRSAEQAKDPPPPLLPEARRPYDPPGPRLQTDPGAEMAALRADEARALATWAWVDEEAGIARIPIERAMELLVEERTAGPVEDSP